MVRRFALALIATLFALAATEAALRQTDIAAPHFVSPLRILGRQTGLDICLPDPDLLVRLRPAAEFLGYYRTNARGWRGDDVPEQPPAGRLRIVALGDSCTFGYGLSEFDAWPSALQRMLDRALGDVLPCEVVNAGIFGYSTFQNRRQAELELAALAPDVVVLFTSGHNDITGNHGRSDAEESAHRNSFLALFEQTRIWRLASHAAPEPDTETLPPGVAGVGWRVSPAETDANLAALVEACRAMGAATVLARPIHGEDARALTPAYDAFAQQVERFARSHATPLADPRPWIEGLSDDTLLLDPVHPSEEASAWLAAAVLEALVSHPGLLPDHPRVDSLAAWALARRSSLAVVNGARVDGDLPAPYATHLDALHQADQDMQLPATAPPDVLAFDPLFGTEVAPRRAGALGLLARTARDQSQAKALAAEARTASAYLAPPDPFARFLGHGPPDPETVARGRALTLFERELGLPTDPHDRRLTGAWTLYRDGELAPSRALLDQALALRPDDPETLHLDAILAQREGQSRRAYEIVQRMLALDPDHAAALTLQARGALKRGDTERALELLDRALRRRPSYAAARYLRGRSLLERGDLDGAERDLSAALTFGRFNEFPDLEQLASDVAAQQATRRAALNPGRDAR